MTQSSESRPRDGEVNAAVVTRHAFRFYRIGNPPAWTIVAISLSIVVGSAIGVLPPIFIGAMIDALQQHEPSKTIHQLLLYVSVSLGSGAIGLASAYASGIFRETIARNLQLYMIAKLGRARFDALAEMTFGQVANRLLGDVRALCTQMENSLFPTLSSTLGLAATIIAMVHEDYRLAAVALVCSLAVFLPLRIVRPRVIALQRRLAQTGDEFYGALGESNSLAALATYRNGAAERGKMAYFEDLTRRLFGLRVRQNVNAGVAGFLSSLAGAVGPSAVLLLGIYLAIRGELSAGTIVTILIYQSRLSAPMTSLAQLQLTVYTMQVIIARLLEVADLPEESSGDVQFSHGEIALNGIKAVRGERTVLHHVDVRIPKGSHLALIGPSGTGKSSLVSLLTRLYEPCEGTISIDGVDLRQFSLDSLRAGIALVAQEPLVFDLSLRENLTLMNPAATSSDLARAIRIARLDSVVSALPNGLDTLLGQRGFRLSGGERQRICLARAILQNPQILILDEALTGVDIEMEQSILSDLRTHFTDRTIVIITHRLGSIRTLDGAIALESGRASLRMRNDLMTVGAGASPA
jgi:ABC-type multidrug transport system fused ATPase/permease subunit